MKVKEIWNKHKKKIIIIGGLGVAVVIGALVKGRIDDAGKTWLDVTGKDTISWVPKKNGYITLERANEILDLNSNNTESLAIFKEGLNYSCILLSDNVVTEPKI